MNLKHLFLKNAAAYGTALVILGLCFLWGDGSWARSRENPPLADPSIVEDERSRAHLYFAGKSNLFLMAEERAMTATETAEAYGSDIVVALIQGPRDGLMRTIPPETKLLALYILKNGTAYVDLTDEIGSGHPGGIQTERLSLYSIVNSLILNVSEIKMVKVLINGRDALTLAGHIDIRYPLKADMLLIR